MEWDKRTDHISELDVISTLKRKRVKDLQICIVQVFFSKLEGYITKIADDNVDWNTEWAVVSVGPPFST